VSASGRGPDGPGEVASERVRQQLSVLLASRLLSIRSRSGQFLEYVVEETLAGRADAIKETAIALQVFHRRPSYDPRVDSIVRVEAHHLRRKLREYYAVDGARDEVVVELPVGSYVPAFQLREAAAPEAPSPPAGSRSRKRLGLAASAAAIALAALGFAGYRVLRPAPPERSIAVLPFKNLGGPEDEALCQGLSEDLTTQLARVADLRVTARTSTSQFQAQGDVRDIGKALSVAAVIEGSIRRDGDRIRFTAQLIDTASGYHKWSEAFDREARHSLAAEAEVPGLIVSAVAKSLGSRHAVAPLRASDPEAVRLFWEARYLRRQGNEETRSRALALLEKAVQLDPQYVDAWAALANLALFRAFHAEGSFEALAGTTRQAAAKAIQLDPGNTDGLVALAEMEWLQDRDWNRAERRLRSALERNPSSASARAWMATGLVAHGRFDDALAELDRAAAISPVSYLVSNDISIALYCARRWDRAIQRARNTLAVNPRFFYARVLIGACLAARGRHTDALREFQQAIQDGGRGAALSRLGNALGFAGRGDEARTILRECQDRLAKGEGSNVDIAIIQVGLRDHAAALASLERALAAHETDLNYLAVDPVFDPLRAEPGYRLLKEKMGL
jgi:TolB-like protein/Tfp pilus assembly protein PilF